MSELNYIKFEAYSTGKKENKAIYRINLSAILTIAEGVFDDTVVVFTPMGGGSDTIAYFKTKEEKEKFLQNIDLRTGSDMDLFINKFLI